MLILFRQGLTIVSMVDMFFSSLASLAVTLKGYVVKKGVVRGGLRGWGAAVPRDGERVAKRGGKGNESPISALVPHGVLPPALRATPFSEGGRNVDNAASAEFPLPGSGGFW